MSTLIQVKPISNPMNTLLGDRLASCQTLTLEKLYHHIFSTLGQPRSVSDHQRHDLVLWLNHHSFDELPDALEYYVVNLNSDIEADPTNLDLLEQKGMKVTIKPFISMILHNLLDWAECFLATYGEYASLYNLLDTPKYVLLRLQQHLHNSTFPRPLLSQSRGRPTL